MRNTTAFVLAFLTLCSPVGSVAAADHVATTETVSSTLADAALSRQSDRDVVAAVLDTDAARAAARRLGADTRQLKAGLNSLTDGELRDLAARAEALQADPVAGMSNDVETLLIIFLLVAIVILVLQAAD